jgi:hypothetical protein
MCFVDRRINAMCRAFLIVLVCAVMVLSGQACKAADSAAAPEKVTDKANVEKEVSTKTVAAAQDKEAAYTKTIEKRTADIMALLDVKDEAKVKGVHDAIMNQYRFLRDWHDTNDAKLKELAKKGDEPAKAEMEKIKVSLKAQHDKFVGELAANLTTEQVDKVKDKLVYGKVQVTYNAYCDMLPKLTDEQKAKILEVLKQGREEAMDGGSSEEKSTIFKKYKGKVNIYLSGQGVDMKQAEKEWQARLKAARGGGGTASESQSQSPEKDAPPAAEKKK